jgi:serine/threonine-protein kinase
MSLAIGGQILLTDTAFNDARQYVNRCPEILKDAPCLRWMAHGRYLFKGADDPLEVYEVGLDKVSPLVRPGDSDKVKRVVPHDQESTLGWRPAAALQVPGRVGWLLLRKLGEGAFGEVWLGEHQKLKELRVFKFCFDVERLRSLKNEYSLFRLLKGALGTRPDIATLYEVKLDDPPYFLESEYSEGGDLLEWSERNGQLKSMPLSKRLEILAKVADAVAAAHSIAVLHKDIKPSNILVHISPSGEVCPILADFGIGFLSDRSRLKGHNVTEGNFAEADTESTAKSFGTRMYSPPESMQDKPYTTGGDIYALGVMLYQITVADFRRPLAGGWERDVEDELLRQDIAAISEGDPTRRVATADEVARRIRTLDKRRAELAETRSAAKAEERRRRMRRLIATVGGGAVCLLTLLAIGGGIYIHNLHIAQARTLAAKAFLLDVIRKSDPANSLTGSPSARDLIIGAAKQLDTTFTDDSDDNADLQLSFADALRNFDDPQAVDHYRAAADIYTRLHGADDRRTLKAQSGQGYALVRLQHYKEAEPILLAALDRQRSVLGPEDRDTLQTALIYAAAVNNVDGPAKAEPLFREALDLRRKDFGDDDPDTIQSLAGYAMVERDLGRLDDAERDAKQALDWRTTHLGPRQFGTLPSLLTYGSILVDLGLAAEAEPMLKTVVECRSAIDPNNSDTLRAEAEYADALTALARYDQAESYYQKATDGLLKQPGGAQNVRAMVALCGYAELLNATKRAADAEPKALQAFNTLSQQLGPDRRETLRAGFAYARILDSLGDPKAKAQYQAAADGALSAFGDTSPFTRQFRDANAQYLAAKKSDGG